ncbi:unnamed protein product [Ostreobium quekettii]|uniref:Uncharacterized protein n=1 Tax=Ostreobium quekettii TaxID=121088 RepID=A0A8S1JCF1_9CHLO|nr:unnamed protein product [Ostreobium quekettii]
MMAWLCLPARSVKENVRWAQAQPRTAWLGRSARPFAAFGAERCSVPCLPPTRATGDEHMLSLIVADRWEMPGGVQGGKSCSATPSNGKQPHKNSTSVRRASGVGALAVVWRMKAAARRSAMAVGVIPLALVAMLLCSFGSAGGRSLSGQKDEECLRASILAVKDCLHATEEDEFTCTMDVARVTDECLDACLANGDCNGSKCVHDFLSTWDECEERGKYTRGKCAQALKVDRHRCPDA